jgi:type II secretory pathway pseudopilin PulG
MLVIVTILGILAASVALTIYMVERAKKKARKKRSKGKTTGS